MNAVEHLRHLVAFDTRNPPRKIDATGGIFGYANQVLTEAGFQVQVTDLGSGCVYLLALRGEPEVLVNVHLDTVPADEGYSADPFTLRIEGDRAIGLGACDIKGAAAAALAAAQQSTGPAAILFSSDEEAGSSTCVKHFCAHLPRPFRVVLVAEPTNVRAVTAHRGIRTFSGHFHGQAGHSSGPSALENNALHKAARWMTAALLMAEDHRNSCRFQGLAGTCFNIGIVEGGKKPNIVAPKAFLRWGIRPLPGQDPDSLAREYKEVASPEEVDWTDGFTGPTLPALAGEAGLDQERQAHQIASDLGLPIGEPVDFWTEAALFSDAGIPAIVFGPGNIAQAHTADEWVSIKDLEDQQGHYERLFREKPKFT